VDDPLTQYFQTEEIALESLSPAWVQSDGEIKENTPAVFKIIPRALWVVCG
jgi:diacylglycerol kinase family enzyme